MHVSITRSANQGLQSLNLTTISEVNSDQITKWDKNIKFSLETPRRNKKLSLRKFRRDFIKKHNKTKSMEWSPSRREKFSEKMSKSKEKLEERKSNLNKFGS